MFPRILYGIYAEHKKFLPLHFLYELKYVPYEKSVVFTDKNGNKAALLLQEVFELFVIIFFLAEKKISIGFELKTFLLTGNRL